MAKIFAQDDGMTWEELSLAIRDMDHDKRKTNVTVFDPNEGEFYPVSTLVFADPEEIDVLDAGHPFMNISA